MSPKLSAIVHATSVVDIFVNAGLGFHSNDARAAVATDGAGALARPATPARRRCPSAGSAPTATSRQRRRSTPAPRSGTGTRRRATTSGPTRRWGIDAELAWQAAPWLGLDANVAVARATFVANAGNGGALALAPRIMGGAGATVHRGGSELSVRARGVDDRPANDDGSLIAPGYLLFDLVAHHAIGRYTLGATLVNALDTRWREAQFAESSRPTPMGAEAEDVHFTPGAPRTALVTVGYRL